VDLALWDLKGKLLRQPVYALLGGPAHEDLFCYATGNDTDWYVELGFEANKLAHLHGLTDGVRGIDATERQVAAAREVLGPERELMLDCWQSFDVEYTVRLAERLRPYRLRWLEECLPPDDLDAHVALRQRLPWQGLAAGEHWYALESFAFACRHQVVDVIQADLQWSGGITAGVKIAHLAEASGLSLMLHAGANTAYGQHFSYAMPAVPWAEMFVASDPGVPLLDAQAMPRGYSNLPGTPVPERGRLRPSDAPGFGLEVSQDWLTPFFA
jgi:L-rhamnonate dehydratase